MNVLEIKETESTPYIKLDESSGILEIRGRSGPDDAVKFYQTLIDALDHSIHKNKKLYKVNIALDFFNISSSKCLFDIFKRIKRMNDKDLIINWFFESNDIDMLEAGEDFASTFDTTN